MVAAIAPHNNVTQQAPLDNNPETSQVNTMESTRSPELLEDSDSPADVVDIAVGGGEAPACRAEVASTSLSTNTSPDSEEGQSDFCPVFAGPSTSSKTQSLPRGSGRVSALVGAMISSSKEYVPPEKIEEEKLPVVAGGDEFTRMFSQDDIRMLVDLLKLAVAGR